MPIWQAPEHSNLLRPAWRDLSRHGLGVWHYKDRDGWNFRLGGETVFRIAGTDEVEVAIAALPVMPGLLVRLTIIGALL